VLGLTLHEFAETGVALAVTFPALGISVWWTGPEAVARAVAAERRLALREVWCLDRLQWEARGTELDIETSYLQRMEQDDPEGYRSEVPGEFRAGVSALFDPEMLEVCVIRAVRERLPEAGVSYRAAADPSDGRRDAFTV
jgi:hypothetical protein